MNQQTSAIWVTDAATEQVVEWQNRHLDAVCPIVYLNCIALKVRQDSRVINKSVSPVPGINIEGQKELLGMWLAENEGALPVAFARSEVVLVGYAHRRGRQRAAQKVTPATSWQTSGPNQVPSSSARLSRPALCLMMGLLV